ncbi:MAG: hypothetical protein WD067_02355 [Gaiellaceae bacterium]
MQHQVWEDRRNSDREGGMGDAALTLHFDGGTYTIFGAPATEEMVAGPDSLLVFFDDGPAVAAILLEDAPATAQHVDVARRGDGFELAFADGPTEAAGELIPEVLLDFTSGPVSVTGEGAGSAGQLVLRLDSPIELSDRTPPDGTRWQVRFDQGAGSATAGPVEPGSIGLLERHDFPNVTGTPSRLPADIGLQPDALLEAGGGIGLLPPEPAAMMSVTGTASTRELELDLPPSGPGGIGILAAQGISDSVTATSFPVEPEIGLLAAQEPMPLTATATGVPFEVEPEPRTLVVPGGGGSRRLVLIGGAVVLATAAVIGGFLLAGNGDEQTATPPVAEQPAVPESWLTLRGLVDAVGAPSAPDPTGDFIYSVPSVTPGNPAPDVDIVDASVGVLEVGAEQAAPLFETGPYACGGDVVCQEGTQLGPGSLVVGSVTLAAPPAGSPGASVYSYDLVFDSDGDPANDFQFEAPFEWDFYQGADRWYHLVHRDGTWFVELSVFDGSRATPQPTAARAVLDGETIGWLIPAAEMADPAGWRAATFRHDGSYQPDVSAGDVNGADPTAPLTALGPGM